MFQLAGEMDSSVLADVLGLSGANAARWAAPSSRDCSLHTAQRAMSLQG